MAAPSHEENRVIRTGIAVMAAALLGVAPLHAQVAVGNDRTPVVPHFGFAIGAGSIPRAFEPNCMDGWEGSTASAAVELRAGLGVGRFRLEARTAPHTEFGLGGAADCLVAEPVLDDGLHTVRSSPIDRGPFILTDLRLAYVLRLEPVEWLISSGAGWIWGRDVPTLVFGSGIRFGSDLRGVVDAEFSMYRVPWDEATQEWLGEDVVRTFDLRSEKLWQKGIALRVGLEVVVGS
jgi:hypothetical protein